MLSKEEIFEALTDWNCWNKPIPATVARYGYEEEVAGNAFSTFAMSSTGFFFPEPVRRDFELN